MGLTKWIHLMFALGGVLLAYVFVQATEWIWGVFTKPKDLYVTMVGVGLAVLVTAVGWRNKSLFAKAGDIVMELSKVTWPTRKETGAATVVVIITVIIFSILLGIFDMIWSWATSIIYS
ncbi:MAG: preprotein translocase subunit SecE [Pseudomonadota bacterium]